jgi:hypothetical protein
MILKQSYNTAGGQVLPLTANQTWQSGWFDNGLSSGAILACISCYSDQAGSIQLVQTDNQSDPNMILPVQNGVAVVPAGRVQVLQASIFHLYWSVIYSNGPTAQTVFDLQISASSNDMLSIVLEVQRVNFNLNRLYNPYSPKDDALNLTFGNF